MLTPNYTIEEKPGKSGRVLWNKKFLWLFIACSEPQIIPFHAFPTLRNFNPYTDLQRGAFTIGFRGKNYSFLWGRLRHKREERAI